MKTLFKLGCFGVMAFTALGVLLVMLGSGLKTVPTPTVAEPAASAVPAVVPAAPPQAVAPAAPMPGAPRGNGSSSWTRSQLRIGDRQLLGVDNVNLTPAGDVHITDANGSYTYVLKDVPQGFLDAWGITGKELDQAAAARDALAVQQQQAKADKEAADLKAAIAAAREEVGCTVTQVINDHEILGSTGRGTTIHVEGIRTNDLTEGQYYSFQVWPQHPYRYVTVLGATSQIISYTGIAPNAPPALAQ